MNFRNPRTWGATAAMAVLTLALTASAGAVGSSVVYNAVPATLPPNVPSLGFEATSTSEFGDYVHLGGTDRNLNTVTVTMSDWALHSDYPTMPDAGWTHPITLSIYSAVPGTPNKVGARLGRATQTFSIPWRPEASPDCGTAWKAPNGGCYNGLAFNITFDLSSLHLTLPNDVIVGIAYNTADYGVEPIHAAGPYNSLNVGVPTNQTSTVGSDVSADNVFWNTSFADFYTDGGTAGVGIFREDTNWTPNGTVAIQISATPLQEQCKDGGWKRFNNPTFKNQGECVSFFATR